MVRLVIWDKIVQFYDVTVMHNKTRVLTNLTVGSRVRCFTRTYVPVHPIIARSAVSAWIAGAFVDIWSNEYRDMYPEWLNKCPLRQHLQMFLYKNWPNGQVVTHVNMLMYLLLIFLESSLKIKLYNDH